MKGMSCFIFGLKPFVTESHRPGLFNDLLHKKVQKKRADFFIRKKTAKTTKTTSALNHSSGNGDAVAKLAVFL